MSKSAALLLLLLFLTAYSTVAGVTEGEWPMFRKDPSHSGYSTSTNQTSSAQLLWTYKTMRMVQSSPAVANGYVVVGCRDGYVYCLSASKGERMWKRFVRDEVWSSLAIHNASVYFGADDGYVYSLSIITGNPLWKTKIGGKVRSSPAVSDGRIYIGSGNQGVYALNVSDGCIIWSYPTSFRVHSSPAVSDGVVYVATDDYYVYALDVAIGKELWRTHTGSVISSPSVYNGYVYIGSIDGYVYGLNATTGAKIWEYRAENAVSSSPTVAYGRVYIGSEDNNVYSLNASTGEKIWQSPTGYWVSSSPAVADGNVYVGSEDHSIYCFDAYTGERRWSYATGNAVESSPAIADGILYVGSDDSHIYAFAIGGSISEHWAANSSNYLSWNTVALNVIVSVVGMIVIFAVFRFIHLNWRDKRKTDLIHKFGKISWFSTHRDAAFCLAILAFSTIFFINLGSGPLWAADERIHSQWAFHMVRTGDYMTPWAFGYLSFYISKPPLHMWLMSIAYQVFGVNNFSSRLPSAVLGALSLIIVFYLGKKLYNSYVGFLAAMVLGTFTSFFLLARHAMTDVTLIFFILASLYFFVLSEKTENSSLYSALGGVFFGLALMTKQTVAFLVPLILFVYLVMTKKSIRFFFEKRFAIFFWIGFLIFLPWTLYMTLSYGPDFLFPYFLNSVFQRSFSSIEGHVGSYSYYFINFFQQENLLWVMLLPFAAGVSAVKGVFKRSRADLLMLVWMVTVVLFFSFVQTKIFFYLLPAFPAFAITIGSLLYQLLKKGAIFFRLLIQENLVLDLFLGVPRVWNCLEFRN